MIYLISVDYYNKETSTPFTLLKIGYSKDVNWEKRFGAYKLHNPACKVLHTIPLGTEEMELALHYKFKSYRFEDYGREWFNYSEEIVEYLKSATIEDLGLLSSSPIMSDVVGNSILKRTDILKNLRESFGVRG